MQEMWWRTLVDDAERLVSTISMMQNHEKSSNIYFRSEEQWRTIVLSIRGINALLISYGSGQPLLGQKLENQESITWLLQKHLSQNDKIREQLETLIQAMKSKEE